MAKLSARGRHELARIAKEKTMPDLVQCSTCNGTGKYLRDLQLGERFLYRTGETCEHCKGEGKCKPSTVWERKTLTLMSDGKVLEKWDVRFQPDHMDPQGRFHSYGWKVRAKIKPGVDVTKWTETYAKVGYVAQKTRV